MQPAEQKQTPFPIIARVSKVVTLAVDRVTGDRVDCPLLVCAATLEALKHYQIESRIMYGQVAWIEILEDQTPVWAGCWGKNFHFWVATQFGEVVDLNTSVACRKRSHGNPNLKAMYSPPILWSREVPGFYRYLPEGIAELDLVEERDKKHFQVVLAQIRENLKRDNLPQVLPNVLPKALNDDSKEDSIDDLDFPNEPILCPGRKVLDDSKGSFRYFERALAVAGIPEAPI